MGGDGGGDRALGVEVGQCATEVAQCAKELQPTPPATSLFPGDNLEMARCGEGVEANLQDAGGPGGEFQDARGPSPLSLPAQAAPYAKAP